MKRGSLFTVPAWCWFGLVGPVVLLSAGCPESGPSYPTARLEGSVTVDREPIPKGRIQFVPKDAKQGLPTSAEIVDGRYVAQHVPLGRVSVIFSATRETGRMVTEYSTPYPEAVSIIPKKYRSGIELEVTGDNPRQDFALQSR